MPDTLNEDSKDVEELISELVANKENITNAEIAQRIDTQVSVVRDVRQRAEKRKMELAKGDDITSTSDSPPIGSTPQNPPRLQSLEKDYNYILNSLQEAIVKVDISEDEPIVQNINQGFVDTFGYTASDIVGESLRSYIIPKKCAEKKSHSDYGTEYELQDNRTVTIKTTTGVREFLCREIPTNEEDQCKLRVYTDVTDQKRHEVELQRQISRLKQKNARLEDKSQQLEQFTSILSHDLRNPINIAEGYISRIESKETEEEVAVVDRALERMKSLIEDTLTLKQQSQPVDELEKHSIPELAESAWELVDTDSSKLQIVDQFEVACDDERIIRLFENLFRNAIEHNDDPVVIRLGIHDTLTNSTRGNTKKAFHVSDDGCGISKDERDQVFKIGETTTRNGTGLGLPIIKRIAEAHRWNVSVIESFDGGAKFVFSGVDIDEQVSGY